MKKILKQLLGSLLAVIIGAEVMPAVCNKKCYLEKKSSPETHHAEEDFGYPMQANLSATITAEFTASGPTGPFEPSNF